MDIIGPTGGRCLKMDVGLFFYDSKSRLGCCKICAGSRLY